VIVLLVLINAVRRFGGIRPAVEPLTYQVDRRYLPNAFGKKPDGSDGGAFIEFLDAPTGSGNVSKYRAFPNETTEFNYAKYWFSNHQQRDSNLLQLLAANREAVMNSLGVADPVESICIIYVGSNVNDVQREETVVHEIGHRFYLVPPRTWEPPNNFSYIDEYVDHLSHDGKEMCIMSYNNIDNGYTEFSIECLIIGSQFGATNSLRDRVDK
jgi:hypothetical protein